MLALRLVRLIETHSEKLSAKILGTFLNSEQCSDLRRLPAEELHARTHELLEHINEWLTARTEQELAARYTELGARRKAQGVRLSHIIWALDETREQLHQFIRAEGMMDNTVELVGMMELMRRLDRFFDRAIYYACVGYESAQPMAARRAGTLDIAASF